MENQEKQPGESQSIPDQKTIVPDYSKLANAFGELQIRINNNEKILSEETKTFKEDIRDQKNMINLGFIVLIVLVATMLLMLGAMIIDSFGSKAAADNELTHSIYLLQAQQKYNNGKSS